MAYSIFTTTFSSPTNIVSIPFTFLSRDHVSIKINGLLQAPSTYAWDNDGQITLGATYPGGTIVTRFRTTPVDNSLVVFEPGSINPQDLNDNTTQLLFAAQECLDQAGAANSVSSNVLDYYQQMSTIYNGFQTVLQNGAALHIDINIPRVSIDALGVLPGPPANTGQILQAFIMPFNATVAGQSVANWVGITTGTTHLASVILRVQQFDPLTGTLSSPIASLTFVAGNRVGAWSRGSGNISKNKLYVVTVDASTPTTGFFDLYASIELIPA